MKTGGTFHAPRCALIVIHASARPAIGQASSETRPQAVWNSNRQDDVRGRSGSDCGAARKLPGKRLTLRKRGT